MFHTAKYFGTQYTSYGFILPSHTLVNLWTFKHKCRGYLNICNLSQKVQVTHLPVFFTFISSKEDDMSYSQKHNVNQGPSLSPSSLSIPVLEAILLQWYPQRRNTDARILFSVLACSTGSNRRVEITVEPSQLSCPDFTSVLSLHCNSLISYSYLLVVFLPWSFCIT